MLMLDFPIEDVHGNRYENAVLLISSIQYNVNQTINSALDLQPAIPARTPDQVSGHIGLNFTAYIFPNPQAVSLKKIPMPFRKKTGEDWFNIVLQAPVNAEDLESVCEQHLSTLILPAFAIPAETGE